jgi:hypothetical protein
MTGKYHNARYERCALCGQYISIGRHSYAMVYAGHNTVYLHYKVCLPLYQKVHTVTIGHLSIGAES